MAGRLRLITPPATEPVTSTDLRLYGRIPSDVPDLALAPLITAARQQAEQYQSRAYITQTWELVFDGFPVGAIALPVSPLLGLTSVTVTDITGTVTTVPTSDFVVDTSGSVGTISLKYGKSWPSVTPEKAGVVIRFTAGYGATDTDVPDRVKTAIILAALWRYDNTDAELPKAFFMELDSDRVGQV